MHYYTFNIGDFMKDSAHLTLEEEGIYRRLIDLYYTTEKPISLDIKSVSRSIRARGSEDAIASILEEFFSKTEKGFKQKRIEQELKKYREKSQKAANSAKARWDKASKESERSTNAMRTHSEGNANHKPITNNHKPITNNNKASPDFSILNLNDNDLSELKRIRKKNKGGTLTDRVIKSLANEFNLAVGKGWSIDEILTEWETRGWKSFKAEWVDSKNQRTVSKITEQNIKNLSGGW